MKTCLKCKKDKGTPDFGLTKGGYLRSYCKPCMVIYVSSRKGEKERERDRAYQRTQRNSDPEKKSESNKLYYEANKEKYRAYKKVFRAIRSGLLKKEICKICGKNSVHAHHEDYSKPLDVVWLCASHHKLRHI